MGCGLEPGSKGVRTHTERTGSPSWPSSPALIAHTWSQRRKRQQGRGGRSLRANLNQSESKRGNWNHINLPDPPLILSVINQCFKLEKFGN